METLEPRALLTDGADCTSTATSSAPAAETPEAADHAAPARRRVPQAMAIQLDELSTQETPLRSVCEQITQCGAIALDTFSTATRHYLLLELPGREGPA